MQLVIDIPDHIYNTVVQTGKFFPYRFDTVRAIKNGTPLPKGHGRLIDADDFRKCFGHSINDMYAITKIDKAPTIIKADKEVLK